MFRGTISNAYLVDFLQTFAKHCFLAYWLACSLLSPVRLTEGEERWIPRESRRWWNVPNWNCIADTIVTSRVISLVRSSKLQERGKTGKPKKKSPFLTSQNIGCSSKDRRWQSWGFDRIRSISGNMYNIPEWADKWCRFSWNCGFGEISWSGWASPQSRQVWFLAMSQNVDGRPKSFCTFRKRCSSSSEWTPCLPLWYLVSRIQTGQNSA